MDFNPFGAQTSKDEKAAHVPFAEREHKSAPFARFLEREHPLEAALEEALDFIYYDHVLSSEEIAAWEADMGRPFVCPLRRIARSVFTHRKTLVMSANGTGKTYQSGRLAAAFCLVRPTDEKTGDYAQVKVGTAPPESNLGKILGFVSSLYHGRGDLFAGYRHSARELRPVHNKNAGIGGQAFRQQGDNAIKKASWKGTHAPHLLIIFDEADGIEDIYYAAADANMIGADDHLVCYFNPNTPLGLVYDMVRKAQGHVIQISAFEHPNVITGENRIPGAVARNDVVWDILTKSRPFVEAEEKDDSRLFRVPQFLDGTRAERDGQRKGPLHAGWRVSMDGALDTKVLGRYPAVSVRRLLKDEWIDKARARWDAYVARYGERPPRHVKGRLGIDPATEGEGDPNSAVRRYGDFVARPQTKPGIDVNALGGWGLTLMRKPGWECDKAFVDIIGVGSGTASTMRDGYTYVPDDAATPIFLPGAGSAITNVDVRTTPRSLGIDTDRFGSFKLLKDYLAWLVMDWLRDEPSMGVRSGAMLPPDENLIRALRIIEVWTDRAGLITTSEKDALRARMGGESPNAYDALAATFMSTDEAERIAPTGLHMKVTL